MLKVFIKKFNSCLVYTKNNFEFHFCEFKIFIEKKLFSFGSVQWCLALKESFLLKDYLCLLENIDITNFFLFGC